MYDYSIAEGYAYTPCSGNVNLLAIPVVVSDYKTSATDSVRQDIQKGLFGTKDQTGWESLASFYKTSSNGQLNITGTVSDWYDPGLTSTQMISKYNQDQNYTSTLLEDAVAWYKKTYNTNMAEFDNDKDGYIDGVFLIYSAPDYATDESLNSDLFWAFTYWDYENEEEPSTSSPIAFTYFWCSYDFIYNSEYGSKVDAHTFCHETGHMMGLQDYYSYTTQRSGKTYNPTGNITMMDYNVTDLDCYSKFAFGWTTPYLIDSEGTLTISLDDSVIIPAKNKTVNNAFDEYLMLEIFGPNGLNEQDLTDGYYQSGLGSTDITKNGIRAYHVDSRLCYLTSSDNYNEAKGYVTDPTEYTRYKNRLYTLAHSNTPAGYSGSEAISSYNYLNPSYRLIQLISNEGTNFAKNEANLTDKALFHAGDKFDNDSATFKNQFEKSTKLNSGYELAYGFEVISIEGDQATLKFTAN